MCVRSFGGLNHWTYDFEEEVVMQFHEISIKMEFCRSQLIRQGNLIPFQKKHEKTPTKIGLQLPKKENIPISPPQKRQERRPFLAVASGPR